VDRLGTQALREIELHEVVDALDHEQAERFVFLTGGSFSDEAVRYFAENGNRRLDKPFTLDELRECVRECVMLWPPL
jgi:hypothetical protein